MPPLWKTVWRLFLKNLKKGLSHDPGIPLRYLSKQKTNKQKTQRDMYTPVLIAILFIIAKMWKQSK